MPPTRPLLLLLCLLLACTCSCSGTLAGTIVDSSRRASSEAQPAAALASASVVPPAAPDYAVIHLQRSPSGRNTSAERSTPGRVGEKQGRSNLSSVSLSLVVLGCLFCCVCVGSIIVRERVRPEEAVTLATPAGGAVGLEQIRKERMKGTTDGAAAEAASVDLESGRQPQQQQQSASTRTAINGQSKEQVAMQRVQDMAARWWSDELTEQRKKSQRTDDDDGQQPPTTPKGATPRNQSGREPHTRVSIAGEATPAAAAAAASAPAQPAAEGGAAAPSATDAPAAAAPAPAVTQPDIPYQPTIILHSTM